MSESYVFLVLLIRPKGNCQNFMYNSVTWTKILLERLVILENGQLSCFMIMTNQGDHY